MARPNHATVRHAIDLAYQNAYREMRIQAGNYLAPLDPADPDTLHLTVNALLKAGYEQKDLAQCLGVSRTTISRWSQKQNIPRSPAFRIWAVDTLRTQLASGKAAPPSQQPLPRRPGSPRAAGHR